MKRWYLIVTLFSLAMISCQRELSFERGNRPVDSIIAPPDNTCFLAEVNETVATTGLSTYTYLSSFDTDHKVARIRVVDSSNTSVYGDFAVSYPAGRIQIGTDQYFIKNADGRISEFHGFEDPENKIGEKIIVKYTYNTAGQLTLRTQAYDSLPGVNVLQMKFSYTSNNLSRETVEFFTGTGYTTYADAVYSYDASKTVKNFLYVYGASPELITFQTAINAGLKNANAVSRIVVTITDPATGTKTTTTSNFTNYIIDSKNYVQSFQVTGDDFNAGGLFAGMKYLLSYSCF
jgi:hypothetical protein